MDNEIRQLAEDLLQRGTETLSERERRILHRIARRRHITRNVNEVAAEEASLGDRMADRVAAVGGSWAFVSGFALFLLAWTVLNSGILAHWREAFDPYPYIFLNLILSMLAAVQAPIIMMSQNRQAAKDRIAAALDYETNLKAELEIMSLHEKLDRLRAEHLDALLQRQGEQLELLRALAAGRA